VVDDYSITTPQPYECTLRWHQETSLNLLDVNWKCPRGKRPRLTGLGWNVCLPSSYRILPTLRSTQPCILPGRVNWVLACLAGVKEVHVHLRRMTGNIQVTLCDSIWQVTLRVSALEFPNFYFMACNW